jgi:hypothetical protein
MRRQLIAVATGGCLSHLSRLVAWMVPPEVPHEFSQAETARWGLFDRKKNHNFTRDIEIDR